MERFVHVIFRKLGPFALHIGDKHSVWCISSFSFQIFNAARQMSHIEAAQCISLSVEGLCALYTLRIWAQWC